jgi:hypothetical protein
LTGTSGVEQDEKFFETVIKREPLRSLMRNQKILTCFPKTGLGRNAVLLLYKDGWIIPNPPVPDATIRLHFEARTPGEFRLEVEVYPYVGSLNKKPELERQMARALTLKADALRSLRQEVISDDALREALGANTERLPDPGRTETQTAVKFSRGLPRDCSADSIPR